MLRIYKRDLLVSTLLKEKFMNKSASDTHIYINIIANNKDNL